VVYQKLAVYGSRGTGAQRVLQERALHDEEVDVIIEVVGGTEERPEVRVVDVDDLSRLHLALGEVTDEEADEALRSAGLGRIEDASTGYLDTAALRAAARDRAAGDDWDQRFDGMVEHARGQGWVSDDGSGLRVHIESAAGA
jgi:hypothetical protein